MPSLVLFFHIPSWLIGCSSYINPKLNPQPMDSNDLCTLKNLDEASLIKALRKRYLSAQIYTNSGLFLISINPYKHIDIYSAENALRYRTKTGGETHPPHVYAVLEQCLRDMNAYGEHTVIINGDSGAGKTACARYMLEYLGIPAMNDADTILEGLGNCKTMLNNNSSRFGKLIRINDTVKIETYLLERSRVTKAPTGERNFHIFYYILANRNETLVNDYIDTREAESSLEELIGSYIALAKSFDSLSINFSDVERILLAIIYLGSVKISDGKILKTDAYHVVVKNLSVDEKTLDDFITTRKIMAGAREEIVKQLTDTESYSIRDSLARILYENLFHHVLEKVNAALQMHHVKNLKLNILDIFGFENFENNGLEQFCINWCNERIHDHFVRDTFEHQKSILLEENVDFKEVDDANIKKIDTIKINRSKALQDIERKVGVADLISEESLINGNAENLALKLTKYVDARIKPGNKLVFQHFNGPLEYQLDDFVIKNKEKCTLGTLFRSSDECTGFSNFILNSPVSSDNVVATFRISLNHLFEIISKTRVKYIKCIKPNGSKIPLEFDDDLVAKQLRSSGVIESIELSRHVYPYQFDIATFINRYPFTTTNDTCVTKGKSRVFMNNDGFVSLETRRLEYTNNLDAEIRRVSHIFITRRIISDIILSKKPMNPHTSDMNENLVMNNEKADDKNEECGENTRLGRIKMKEKQCMKFIAVLEEDAISEYKAVCLETEVGGSGIVNTLENENRNLRKVVQDLKNELEIIKHLKISAKSINAQIFQSKYTIKANNDLELLKEKFQDITFIGNCTSDISLFGVFKSLIDLFLENYPSYSDVVYSKDEMLCFAQCVYYMICSSFQQNVKGAFDIFIDELNKQASTFQEDPSSLLYVVSNIIELRCLFKGRLSTLGMIVDNFTSSSQVPLYGSAIDQASESSVYDLDSEVAFIMYVLRELDLSVGNMFEQFGALLVENMSEILPDAILEYEPLKNLNSKTKTIKKWFFSPPTISKMIQYLEHFHGMCKYYTIPESHTLAVVTFCLSVINQITFNSFVKRKKPVNFSKCYEIKYNLAEIEKFCFNIGFRDGFNNLKDLNESIKIASAISRLELYSEAYRSPEVSQDYALELEDVRGVMRNSFLNCNQVRVIAAKFTVAPVIDVMEHDPNLEVLIPNPNLVSPDMDQLIAESKFVEPSYLPQRMLTKILQYFYDS